MLLNVRFLDKSCYNKIIAISQPDPDCGSIAPNHPGRQLIKSFFILCNAGYVKWEGQYSHLFYIADFFNKTVNQ